MLISLSSDVPWTDTSCILTFCYSLPSPHPTLWYCLDQKSKPLGWIYELIVHVCIPCSYHHTLHHTPECQWWTSRSQTHCFHSYLTCTSTHWRLLWMWRDWSSGHGTDWCWHIYRLPAYGVKQRLAKRVCYLVKHLRCQLSFEQPGNGSVTEQLE